MAYVFTDPLDVKLIILYIIKNYNDALDNGQVTDIFMAHDFVDYFTMQTYLEEMVGNNLVRIYMEDSLRTYVLTGYGEEALDAFKDRIPLSVREKILESIKNYKKKQQKQMQVTATYRPVNELDYVMECSLSENGTPLLNLQINAGTAEFAKLGCEMFRNDPQKIYELLLKTLWGEV
ncbi:MAG: DUF4364 family protein [Clostridia bacterium]|nr:DUF4364 family protein [Clostridia bacterium]